jgi:hypothetical protein
MKLAVLEAAHKQGLVSEASYLDQKAALQKSAFVAELHSLDVERAAVARDMASTLAVKPKSKSDRLEQQARLNGLKKQGLDLDAKTLDVQARQTEKAQELDTARFDALQKQRAQIAEMEAELERMSGYESGKTIAHQRVKSTEERQTLSNGGATPQQLAEFDALEKLKEEKIKIEALDREGERIGREAALSEAQVEQQMLGHSISHSEADQKLTAIRVDEITQLQQLSAAYAQYGEAGRDAESKVQREITETMQSMEKESDNRLKQIGDGYAHALFDPLFDMSEKWSKKGKSISDGMLRMSSQLAEKQLFGSLFGDDEDSGSGRKIAAGRKGIGGTDGLVGDGLSKLSGLFHKKTSNVSNGTGASGAGATPNPAASSLQIGKGTGSGSGGVQVIINNTGTPADVAGTQVSGGSGADLEQMVIQVMLKQADINGAAYQAFTSQRV